MSYTPPTWQTLTRKTHLILRTDDGSQQHRHESTEKGIARFRAVEGLYEGFLRLDRPYRRLFLQALPDDVQDKLLCLAVQRRPRCQVAVAGCAARKNDSLLLLPLEKIASAG